MDYRFTPSAQRAIQRATDWLGDDVGPLPARALLMGILGDPECRGATIAAAHGIDLDSASLRWSPKAVVSANAAVPPAVADAPSLRYADAPSDDGLDGLRLDRDAELSLQAACRRLAGFPRPLVLATEHLLLGLVAAGHEVSQWLRGRGLDADALEAEVHRIHNHDAAPPPQTGHPPVETSGLLRIVDAAGNRAREAIRVVEDHVRFVLDDRHLTERCKQIRHDLTQAVQRISAAHRLAARDTLADVGTQLSTATERSRKDLSEVLAANFARLQEALRSLEEYGKLLHPDVAAQFQQLRYRTYTVQRAVCITTAGAARLAGARLYVLIDGRPDLRQFDCLVQSLVGCGVGVIQLRDKTLDDRTLLDRARSLRRLTRSTATLFVMNDRADLAALAEADGVHVGQEELAVKDARAIVGPDRLVGVSAHSIQQARQAVMEGADYLGVGPVFPSDTKAFAAFPGLELVRAVAAETRLPAFAIGGIHLGNIDDVLATGIGRVAVSGAVLAAGDPAAAAKSLMEKLG